MPTIRIDAEVYRNLQEQAVAFVDTPNSVIRRLLGLPSADGGGVPTDGKKKSASRTKGGAPAASRSRKKAKSSRAPRGSRLPDTEYELPLLAALVSLGGSAPTREVLNALEPEIDGSLTDVDRQPLSSGDVRWRNRAQFVRLKLVQRGDMDSHSPRGIWSITDQGRERLRSTRYEAS